MSRIGSKRWMKKIPRDEAIARALIRKLIETFLGIVPLHQELVPRDFLMEGRRLKVIPEHLFAYGTKRGPLSEWWIASDTQCDNGQTPGSGKEFPRP